MHHALASILLFVCQTLFVHNTVTVVKTSGVLISTRLVTEPPPSANSNHSYQLEKQRTELEHIISEKEAVVQSRNALLACTMLIMLGSLLFINRLSIKRKKEAAEKKLIETELINAKKRLDLFTKMLHEKNHLLEISTVEIENLKAMLKGLQTIEQDPPFDLLRKLQKFTILTDEDWVEFCDVFDRVHEGFLYRLKKQIPELTPAEVRYFTLSKLQFNNKEIGNILGINASTSRNYKSRLIKKLGLEEAGELSALIDSI